MAATNFKNLDYKALEIHKQIAFASNNIVKLSND
jgi:hypothetical protein